MQTISSVRIYQKDRPGTQHALYISVINLSGKLQCVDLRCGVGEAKSRRPMIKRCAAAPGEVSMWG
jgi:hypothetical protein